MGKRTKDLKKKNRENGLLKNNRIKGRKKAIKLILKESESLDKQLERRYEYLVESRRDFQSTCIEANLSKKERDGLFTLIQNVVLETQHDIAEIYVRRRELRDELVRRYDDLDQEINYQINAEAEQKQKAPSTMDFSDLQMENIDIVGC